MTSILGELQVGDSGQVIAFRDAGAAYRRKLLQWVNAWNPFYS